MNACCNAIAEALSQKLGVLLAPLLPYGNSIPFKSFEGSAGIHDKSLSGFLFESCNSWIFHGFKRIMIFTLTFDGHRSIDRMVKRIDRIHGQ